MFSTRKNNIIVFTKILIFSDKFRVGMQIGQNMIERIITPKIIEASKEFPVITIVGPRQSGKTTLAKTVFQKHTYISLEDYDVRELAKVDPRRFLIDYPSEFGLILDEIQHVPQLLSYIQTIVDREQKNGFYIITGSNNFLVSDAISQTLAGRIAIFTLLPLSIEELENAQLLPEKIETLVYNGGYPKIYAHPVSIERLYKNYIQTYLERDVRQIKQVSDLLLFKKFINLCVGGVGQILNLTSLSNDCGVTQNTVKSWLSLLEASYIIFLLYPYYQNFGKRVIKSPKLYFVDIGLACNLLNIPSESALIDHYLRSNLIESFFISDLLKQQYNQDKKPTLYFWRDQTGNEIDCIIDQEHPVSIEIKSGKTVNPDFFKPLAQWQQLTQNDPKFSYVMYGGSENQQWPHAQVVNWKSAGALIENIRKIEK